MNNGDLLRVVAPRFVAGVIVSNQHVSKSEPRITYAAPILRRWVGKTVKQFIFFCRSQGWIVENLNHLRGTSAYEVFKEATMQERLNKFELQNLDKVLKEAVDREHDLTEWETTFVNDLIEKREKRKDNLQLSRKQLDIVERIGAKLGV